MRKGMSTFSLKLWFAGGDVTKGELPGSEETNG